MPTASFRKKILVCDDDAAITDMLEMLLMYHGFEVIPVLNSLEIFDKIAAVHPDIILLDLWMPSLAGDVIVQRLKAAPATHSIPVFLLSASTDGAQIAKSCGADAFIAKPFDTATLLATINSALQRS